MITISIPVTDAQEQVLKTLSAPHISTSLERDAIIRAYEVIDDNQVRLFSIKPDGSYTYESLHHGFHQGWYRFNEEGVEIDENSVVIPGGLVDD